MGRGRPPLTLKQRAERQANVLRGRPWWAPEVTSATIGEVGFPYGRGSIGPATVYHYPRWLVLGWAGSRPTRLFAVWACGSISRRPKLGRTVGDLESPWRPALKPCAGCEHARESGDGSIPFQ